MVTRFSYWITGIILLLTGIIYSIPPVTILQNNSNSDKISALYHLNRDNATQLDETKNGNNGTVIFAFYKPQGKINGCYSFKTGSTINITLPTTLIDAVTSGTISAWIYPTNNGVDSLPSGGQLFTTFIGKGNTYLSFGMESHNYLRAWLYHGAGTTDTGFLQGTNAVSLNTWTHVAWIWDCYGSTITKNGLFEAGGSTTPAIDAWPVTTRMCDSLRVGGIAYIGQSGGGNSNYNFYGDIDEVLISSRNMSIDEIKNYYYRNPKCRTN